MSNHGCINGTLDGTNYSSPVPVIGLYIAAATLVSLILMIYDVLVGFYTRKRWLPCKMFKLDSVTLTFVSVAVKLTVDLTTPMPSVWDQLSKLCGTSLLCAYMGYIIPSVGVMNDSTNMYSLSILVITVFVNMCIQISTGVVVLFIPEHILILCFMLVMLLIMWFWADELTNIRKHTRETNKNLFRRSKETVLKRLQICYLYGYVSDTQFIACKEAICICIGGLNLFCLVILVHTSYRSVIMKSEKWCMGNSAYEWSMPLIVLTQILTVLVGSSVSIYRWLTMMIHGAPSYIGAGEPYESNPIFDVSLLLSFYRYVRFVVYWVIVIITFPVSFLVLICDVVTKEIFNSGHNAIKEEFEYLIKDGIGIDDWTLGKGLTELEKEMEVSKSDQPNYLMRLLSGITTSRKSQVEHILDRVGSDEESIPVCTLSVVLLIRIAQVSLPRDLNSSLVKTFRVVYGFLCFIEESLYLTSTEFAKNLEVARAVWLANDFSLLVVKTFDECATGISDQFDTNCALAIIAEVKKNMPKDMIYSELSIIENNINRRQYSSVKELFDYIEQLYIDMLHVILAQFPTAIFNALSTESTSEAYQERVRFALKFVCKIEPLEAQIQWKFPPGSNLLGLITAPVLTTEEEGNAAVNNYDVLHATEDTATVAIHDDNDVIIVIEDPNLRTVS